MPRHSLSIGFDILLPIVFGTLFILHVMFVMAVSSVWFALLYMRSNSRRDKNLSPMPLLGTLVAIGLFTTIVLAAHWYQPAKRERQLMERRVSLPADDVTLADLSFYFSRWNDEHPVLSSFTFSDADKDKVIHLPSKNPTVRQTLDAIQRDAGIEGQFRHCGNGFSILYGPDCCFGLNVHARGIQGEPFDVSEYAYQKLAELNARQHSVP